MKAAEHGKHPSSPERPSPDNQNIGGREFGQVIEPMQAEIASENDGLTESSAGRPRENQKKMPGKGRKAA